MNLKSLLLFAVVGLSLAHADVKLHPLFTDHAVLQRDLPVPIWGTAKPGEKVTVSFSGKTVSVTAGADGRWLAKLAPMPA